jgi:galactokinase
MTAGGKRPDPKSSSARARVTAAFAREFGARHDVLVRAPGRVNLIGEHTDYNEGFVLPMAIESAVWIAARARPDRVIHVDSLDLDSSLTLDLDSLDAGRDGWGKYVAGVAWALQQAGFVLHGWEGKLASDVPVGAGLSSSAALELAVARIFLHLAGLPWDPPRMALLCQRAENDFVGLRCGIMDQMASAVAQRSHAILLDCRSLRTEPVRLPPDCTVVVLDTGTRRGLENSAYNERRAQCEEAVRRLGVASLRDVTPDQLAAHAGELPDVVARRAWHIVTENERVLQCATALRSGDLSRAGLLFQESHASMRDLYDISGPALDWIVEAALECDGCYGARLTGAGFAGCAVALVDVRSAEAFQVDVIRRYARSTEHYASAFASTPAQGAEVVEPAGD